MYYQLIYGFIIGAFINSLQLIKMKNIILALALVYLGISVIVIKSEADDIITSPGPVRPAARNFYPYPYNVDIANSGAVWIWDQNWNNQYTPPKITVTDNFYATCKNEMTLNATADDLFDITLNTQKILSGYNWKQIFTVKFTPVCGRNNFSMTGYNIGIGDQINPAGLIYWISQNDSSCYICDPGQTWNPRTCQCECAKHCQCRRDQKLTDFPSCKCVCANTSQCSSNKYWDENTCSCKCLPKLCQQRLTFNENTCQCVCIKDVDCAPRFEWSYKTCRCEGGFKQDIPFNVLNSLLN